jgi:hypothetical protein
VTNLGSFIPLSRAKINIYISLDIRMNDVSSIGTKRWQNPTPAGLTNLFKDLGDGGLIDFDELLRDVSGGGPRGDHGGVRTCSLLSSLSYCCRASNSEMKVAGVLAVAGRRAWIRRFLSRRVFRRREN